jgi:hypothetical protein
MLAEVVDREDVWMVQRALRARFLLEAREPFGVGGEGGGQDLDGDVATEPRIAAR